MFEKFKQITEFAKKAATDAAVAVGDLNGDGVVDEHDAQIAANWAKKSAGSIADEATRLGNEAVRSDLAKDAAAGAAIGAVVAVPVPVIGPVAGAVIGAGLGVYKNFTRKGPAPAQTLDAPRVAVDIHAELLKLADLKEKGILTETEFGQQKRKLLTRDA